MMALGLLMEWGEFFIHPNNNDTLFSENDRKTFSPKGKWFLQRGSFQEGVVPDRFHGTYQLNWFQVRYNYVDLWTMKKSHLQANKVQSWLHHWSSLYFSLIGFQNKPMRCPTNESHHKITRLAKYNVSSWGSVAKDHVLYRLAKKITISVKMQLQQNLSSKGAFLWSRRAPCGWHVNWLWYPASWMIAHPISRLFLVNECWIK